MIEMECPHCGGRGSAPREKANVRLLCRKCHGVFHMSAAGRTVAGDPPGAHGPGRTAEPGAKPATKPYEDPPMLRALMKMGITRTRVLITRALVFGAALIVLGFYLWQASPAELLSAKAEYAAEALASGNASYLRRISTPASVAEFDKWYELVRPRVDDLKKRAGGSLQAMVLVRSEDEAAGQGEVVIILKPPDEPAAKQADPAESRSSKPVDTGSNKSSIELTTFWGPPGLGYGTWGIDALKTLDHFRLNQPQ